ncbi:MAG: hypothetical protein KKA38_10970 [Euryarchaeota archaeon]|nr:hypothetical protein [Euryarchaeota archaeon]MBV1734247.1 hypothetical protein [Desulforudis sp.]
MAMPFGKKIEEQEKLVTRFEADEATIEAQTDLAELQEQASRTDAEQAKIDEQKRRDDARKKW